MRILYYKQFGFRKNFSAAYTIVDLTENIQQNIICGIFIDLKKAFGTVDHKLLLKKNLLIIELEVLLITGLTIITGSIIVCPH